MSEAPAEEIPLARVPWRRAGLFFGGFWLIVLAEPIGDLFHRGPPAWQEALGLAVAAAFVLLYLTHLRTPFAGTPGSRPARFVPYLLLGLTLAWLPLTGPSGLIALAFVTVSMQANLLKPEAIAATVVVVVVLAVLPHLDLPGGPVSGSYAVSAGASALAMYGVVRLSERNRQLLLAQVQLARLAVVDERARFSRDLHDILGHSLTVVAMKAELARRLVDRDPEAGKREIADIERLARQALADVRATVGGYRDVSLAGELVSARIALRAAGIEPDLPTAVDDVPDDRREVYGWIVREGVTNVVRHSAAGRCAVRLLPDGIEVLDDGRAGPPPEPGHGLAGLRDRVTATGGTLLAEGVPGGGFRLEARW